MPIILIEDYSGISVGIQAALEGEGHQVYTVDCGEKALLLLNQIQPKLILLDLKTKGISALSFVEYLNSFFKITGNKKPCLGILSANSNIEVIAQELKADFFIRKPFEPDELLAAIAKI